MGVACLNFRGENFRGCMAVKSQNSWRFSPSKISFYTVLSDQCRGAPVYLHVCIVCIQCRYKTQIVNLLITMQRYVVCNIGCKDFMCLLNPPQCRALHKQLNHNSVLRTKLAQELQVATDTIQQLQVCQYHDTCSGNSRIQFSSSKQMHVSITHWYYHRVNRNYIYIRKGLDTRTVVYWASANVPCQGVSVAASILLAMYIII